MSKATKMSKAKAKNVLAIGMNAAGEWTTYPTPSYKGWTYGPPVNPESKYVWVVWPIERNGDYSLTPDMEMMKALPSFPEAIEHGLKLMAMEIESLDYVRGKKIKYKRYYDFKVKALEANFES